MSETREFADHIIDLLEVFGRCEARRMFGGHGIFYRGLMFGLIAEGKLYLKADDESRVLFEAEDSDAFTYYRQNKPYRLSYYSAPEAFFEDSEACRHWARIAFDAALRNPKKAAKKKA